ARGWLEPSAGRGSIALAAERFTFDRIDSILRDSVVIDYDKTAIGGQLQLELGDGRLGFDGTLELSGATVFHPMLAAKPVTGIDARGWVQGSFDSRTRALRVDTAEMQLRGVDYRLSGALHLPGGLDSDSGETRAQPRLSARLVIPPLPCQRMLQGIPAAMMPYVTGYRLKGTFDADVRTNIDWADLQASTLDGAIGIFGCKVIDEPEADAETGVLRLQESFTHYVEVEEDQWIDFVIGPDNEDFVPIWDVSHHLTDSLMTTEDSRFYKHRGFIVREFRTALISNLEAGYFRFGASSITMQTVKNVLLYREKTLSRKLQELFLTWHLENRLDKDRIFEIYLNAIEYGPGLYGIGPAARHYFGKHPRDLNPVEAAFFSSILPSPKRRYRQYCDDKLTRWGRSKIARVLKTMHKRGRLTDEEYEIAAVTPLVFDRTEAPPQRECRRMIKRAIKNARPTNPMAR
ncbi:MAG: biosynthetic peptidoglycan transglycosylase, partial [Myxococcota bacterium]